VPLLVKFPRQRNGAVVDDLTGLDAVFALAQGKAWRDPASLYLENPEGWALRSGPYKAIAARDGAEPRLFNLHSDSYERAPLREPALAQSLADGAMALRAEADSRAARWTAAEPPPLDARLVERLRGLGYW
jgi:hypothetical protein